MNDLVWRLVFDVCCFPQDRGVVVWILTVNLFSFLGLLLMPACLLACLGFTILLLGLWRLASSGYRSLYVVLGGFSYVLPQWLVPSTLSLLGVAFTTVTTTVTGIDGDSWHNNNNDIFLQELLAADDLAELELLLLAAEQKVRTLYTWRVWCVVLLVRMV